MWSWLASLIGGPVVNGLINAYKARLDASNTQDRIAADLAAKEIEAEIVARKEASAIIIAEQGRWYTAIIRPLLAFPIIIYFWKVIVFDKVLGLGTTDPITGMVADWTGMPRNDRYNSPTLQFRRGVDGPLGQAGETVPATGAPRLRPAAPQFLTE